MDKQIISFLINAKQATYAGKGAETASSRIKSHDLIYRDGDYMYYDTYLAATGLPVKKPSGSLIFRFGA